MPTTINPSDQTITQHNVLVGGANNTVSSVAPGTNGNVLTSNGTDWTSAASGGGGGVTGPVSSTNNAIATWNGAGGTALFSPPSPLVSSAGIMTNSNQPAFRAYLSADQTGFSSAQVPFDTTNFNQGTNYSTSTHNFTAPVTGIYHFDMTLYINTITSATEFVMYTSGTAGYNIYDFNPTAIKDANGGIILSSGMNISMTAGDIIGVFTFLNSGTMTIGSGSNYSCFSGYLVC